MSPSHGGRFTLERLASSSEGAEYAAVLATPNGTWRGSCRVTDADGRIDWDRWAAESGHGAGLPDAPPEWLTAAARAALRTAWRGHAAAPESDWPRRIARWRPEPR